MARESSVVTRLIESAQTEPITAEITRPRIPIRREITRTVKIAVRRARSLPVAAALVMVVAAFIGGVVLADWKPTHGVTPAVIHAPGSVPGPAPALAPASDASIDTGFDLRVSPAGAAVVLDGRAIGAAPLRVRNLTAGEHVIELSAGGYFSRRLSIALEDGDARRVDVALDPLEPAASASRDEPAASPPKNEAAASPPEDEPAPERPPQRERAERRADTPERATGTLKIGSKPPCEVRINGRVVGTTPEMIELGAGRHSISLSNPTYAISERIRVTIKPGETVKVIRDYSDTLQSSAP